MSRKVWLRCAVLLALLAVPLSLPGLQATSYGGWPAVGFAAALLVVAGRAHRRVAVVAELVVVTTALSISYAVSPLVAAVGSVAVLLPALLTGVLLGGDRGGLRHADVHGPRYHLVILVSGLLCGLLSTGLVAVIMQPAEALVAGVMAGLAAITAQLVVLPLLLPRSARSAVGSAGELFVQRALMAVLTLAVFLPDTRLAIAFMVFPTLGWAAVRASRREATIQLFAVSLAAYLFTAYGLGPLAGSMRGLPAELTPALVYTFVAAACYLIVPLALGVERLYTMTGQATRSALTVDRLLDSASGTLLVATDARGRIRHHNPGARAMTGYAPEEVLGKSPAMFHSDDENARHAAHLGVPADHTRVVLAMVESGERRDWAFRHKDGSTRMASLTLSAVTEADDAVVGYIAVGEDITERLRVQDALRAALDREHASVLRLEEVDHVKQELVSNVSHELRTPITSISGYAELLGDGTLGALSSQQIDAVRRIERSSVRLGLLVDDLLTLARSEAGTLELEFTDTDLCDIIRDAREVLADQLRDRDLRVDVHLPAKPVRLQGDAAALERVVLNVWGNAIKFTPDGGQVEVSLVAAATCARLVVRDSGIGIPFEDQEHLFTRFFRSSAATALAIQGTGLGLSIVHAIVGQHNGSVSVDSAPGAGTAVTVLLPLAAGATAPDVSSLSPESR